MAMDKKTLWSAKCQADAVLGQVPQAVQWFGLPKRPRMEPLSAPAMQLTWSSGSSVHGDGFPHPRRALCYSSQLFGCWPSNTLCTFAARQEAVESVSPSMVLQRQPALEFENSIEELRPFGQGVLVRVAGAIHAVSPKESWEVLFSHRQFGVRRLVPMLKGQDTLGLIRDRGVCSIDLQTSSSHELEVAGCMCGTWLSRGVILTGGTGGFTMSDFRVSKALPVQHLRTPFQRFRDVSMRPGGHQALVTSDISTFVFDVRRLSKPLHGWLLPDAGLVTVRRRRVLPRRYFGIDWHEGSDTWAAITCFGGRDLVAMRHRGSTYASMHKQIHRPDACCGAAVMPVDCGRSCVALIAMMEFTGPVGVWLESPPFRRGQARVVHQEQPVEEEDVYSNVEKAMEFMQQPVAVAGALSVLNLAREEPEEPDLEDLSAVDMRLRRILELEAQNRELKRRNQRLEQAKQERKALERTKRECHVEHLEALAQRYREATEREREWTDVLHAKLGEELEVPAVSRVDQVVEGLQELDPTCEDVTPHFFLHQLEGAFSEAEAAALAMSLWHNQPVAVADISATRRVRGVLMMLNLPLPRAWRLTDPSQLPRKPPPDLLEIIQAAQSRANPKEAPPPSAALAMRILLEALRRVGVLTPENSPNVGASLDTSCGDVEVIEEYLARYQPIALDTCLWDQMQCLVLSRRATTWHQRFAHSEVPVQMAEDTDAAKDTEMQALWAEMVDRLSPEALEELGQLSEFETFMDLLQGRDVRMTAQKLMNMFKVTAQFVFPKQSPEKPLLPSQSPKETMSTAWDARTRCPAERLEHILRFIRTSTAIAR